MPELCRVGVHSSDARCESSGGGVGGTAMGRRFAAPTRGGWRVQSRGGRAGFDERRLHRIYPGVYAVGHPALAIEGKMAAALFYAGPGAALCGVTAGSWLGLIQAEPRRLHVCTPRRRRSLPDVRVHVSRNVRARLAQRPSRHPSGADAARHRCGRALHRAAPGAGRGRVPEARDARRGRGGAGPRPSRAAPRCGRRSNATVPSSPRPRAWRRSSSSSASATPLPHPT